ncbi:hypothetical protein [Paraburkholderia sp. J10-1]|uniref:DEAD/DEAH box helicase family protein n=1 Tax=Paraburkholderia sp. J10-1 TaxID=2805430 RepID=UPI002AB795F1|nr:hypothetical protein [Paraburkholderia sp. J10-1]
MARKSQQALLPEDSRYLEFVKRYAFDCTRFAIEVCGLKPTHQQIELFDSVSMSGSRTSVSSGHGTGKTLSYAVIALWHLLCYNLSNTIISAPKISTVQDGVWKGFADLSAQIQGGLQAWIWDYFTITATRVYVKGFKANWWVTAKTAPRGSPENLAGAHRDWLLWLIDEASGVPDANYSVITGSLTDARNRMCLASQPTRSSGFFYDTHHQLSLEDGGKWNNLVFNSEESPLVSVEAIAEKRTQYTEEEYEIKIRGRFPENSSKYLLGPRAITDCIGREVFGPDEEYGWILPVDVGGGGYRDESVILAMKVSGNGEYGDDARRAQLVAVPLCTNEKDISDLHGDIANESGERSNSTAVIDAGGIGLAVCKALDKAGFGNYIKVNWGNPNFSKEYKSRYVNQRAQATCGLARAVTEGRFGISADLPKAFLKKLVKQGSRIPYHWDDKARRYIEKKETMRKDGIPSPDIWDACSFPFLESVHYTLSDDVAVASGQGSAAIQAAREKLKGELGVES